MNKILNILKHKGLVNKKGPNASVINSLSISKISDIALEIKNVIHSSYQLAKSPIYSHSASLSLGGSRVECTDIHCRLSRIRKLSRFTSLYSDEVYINNFLSDYEDPDFFHDIEMVREGLFEDLLIIHEIAPLIEQGFIKFFSPRTDICFSCQAKRFISLKAGKSFNLNYKKLQSEYLKHLNVKCELNKFDEYKFCFDCPEPYLPHPLYGSYEEVPNPIITRPKILKRINEGNQVSLSKTLIKELGFHTELAHDLAANVIFGIATSGALHTSFLTENNIDISFLNSLHNETKIREKNRIAMEHLSSIVPFIDDVSIKDILKLRKREQEAFILFRSAFNEAIDEFRQSSETFNENSAKELYQDVINPKLVALDKKLKKSKKDLITKPFRSITGVVGVISFGLITGLIPPDISEIAKAIGLIKVGSDAIQQTMTLGDSEEKIRSDNFYFLWKVRNKSKK